MIDIEIKGAEQFLALSKALKSAGRTEMRKELHKSMRDAVNKVKPEAAAALAAALPLALSGKASGVKQAVLVKTGADPGVSVVVRYGKAGRGLSARNAVDVNDAGVFRHPVFDTGEWVDQLAPGGKGWFDKTYMDEAPAIRDDLERVVEDVLDRITQKAR